MWSVAIRFSLNYNVFDHVTVDISEAVLAALELESEAFVVHTK